ncbi:MAG: alpha/beta hydrolase [Betaproteobacteria bacterium]|nr:alpha/beta hydrolase [Betaproteobacteria bacterium]
MSAKPRHVHASDLQGIGRLAIDATLGITGIVETMHHNISLVPGPLGKATRKPTKGITGLVYRSIRGVTRLVGGGVDLALANLASLVGEEPSSPAREAVLAALNGVLGDHLAGSGNPLAIPMRFRRGGQALVLRRPSLAKAIAEPTGRILILVHGLCRNDLQWERNGHDHGAAIAAEPGIEPRCTPVYLHYNSGMHVSTNGRQFARLVESLVRAWPVPVEEIVIVAHSMGGLVARSAVHYATGERRAWTGKLTKIVFLGTPHDGAPLERGGNWVNVVLDRSPYTTALARLGKLRSAGITDLRHGNLLDDDWSGKDRFATTHRVGQKRRLVPLPAGVQCFAAAASLARKGASLRERFLGDGLVPVPSALGLGRTPKGALGVPANRQWIGYGMNHLDLLDRPEVYDRIRRWLA